MHDMNGLKDRVEREIQEIMGEKNWTPQHAEVLEELLSCEKCIKEIERFGKADSHYYPMREEQEHMPPMQYHREEKEYPYMRSSRPYMPIHVNYHKYPYEDEYPYMPPYMMKKDMMKEPYPSMYDYGYMPPMMYGGDMMRRPYEYDYDEFARGNGRRMGRGRRYYDDDEDEQERKHYESGSSGGNTGSNASSGSNLGNSGNTTTSASTGGSTSVKR